MSEKISNNEQIMVENNKVGELIALIDAKSRKDVEICCNKEGMLQLEVMFVKKMYLFENKEISLKEIETILHITQSDVTRISRKLEEKGLIEKYADPTDFRKRRVIMKLTEKGCRYARNYYDKLEEMNKVLLQGISDEEEEILKKLLRQIYFNIRDIDPLRDL